jgi:hypothetical protein
MVGIVLSEEQVRSAPPEVRRWLYGLMERTLEPGHDVHYDRGGFHYAGDDLAVCGPDEVLRLFSAIRGEPLMAELFFRLGRDNYDRATGRHTPLPVTTAALVEDLPIVPAQLDQALAPLNKVLRGLRGDPQAVLFRRDEAGNYLVHERTQWNIQQLLQHLIEAEKRALEAEKRAQGLPLTFTPPYRRPAPAAE